MRTRLFAPFMLAGLLAILLLSPSAQASGGTALGWGYNYYGEANGSPTTTTTCDCLMTPAPIAGLSGVTQITGGEYSTIALLSDGSVKSWGYNYYGQLGNGATTEESNPTPTTIPGLSNVIAVAGGDDHALALLSNGTVMAWGENEYGQLGLGTFEGPEKCNTSYDCSAHPVPVPGLANVVAIAAGGDESMALLADGSVRAWGYDYEGQTGRGAGTYEGCYCVDTPTQVPGVSNAIAISTGEAFGMALLADRTVTAWGESVYGALGNGATTGNPTCDCLPPTKVLLSGVKSIAAGDYQGTAVLLDGTVMAWGYNYYGQVGNGTSTTTSCECIPAPVAVLGGAQSTDAGYYDSYALLADGTVRGWGYNGYGELGDGTTEERLSPVPTVGITGASAIGVREYGAAAIIGPSQMLNVAFAGAGSGSVLGADEISCPPVCSGKYPQGRVNILRAVPTSAGQFAGFSGPCTGTGLCQAKMEADETVTATFGVPKGTTITKAKIQSPKKKATFSFTAPGAITGFECLLIKPKPKKAKKGKKHARVELKKPAKPKFATCTGPKAYKNLKPGSYTFKVRALDILGADATPALKKFTIKKPKPKKHKAKH